MSEIYSDCKISDSSGDRAEVNIVDADDGESDEVEFGDVGEDNVGDDIILFALFDNVRTWLGRLPFNVNAIAGGERGTAKAKAGHERQTRDGFLTQEHGLLFARWRPGRIAVMSSGLHSLAHSPFNRPYEFLHR